MSDDRIPRPTPGYIAVTVAAGVVAGAVIGVGLGLLLASVVGGVLVGLGVAVVIVAAALLAVRRQGSGVIEGGAPPQTGFPPDPSLGGPI